MKCFICFIGKAGFIGQQCECDPQVTPPDVPENGVVSNGIQTVHNGVILVHNGD